MSVPKYLMTICFTCTAILALGCDDDPADHEADSTIDTASEVDAGRDGTDTENDSEVEGDTATETEPGADVITGATPGVESMVLGSGHDGWGEHDCFGCHDSFHVNNYVLGDCVSCHGVNGAPLRPAPHDDQGCAECHEDVHPDRDEVKTDACRACHRIDVEDDGTCAYSESYDVIVIGSGGGGLAAAAMASRLGRKVLVVEQHYKTGGCMVDFTRGDYRFDASLHLFPGSGLELFEPLGIADRLVPVAGETLYRVVTPERVFDVPADRAAYQAALKAAFPDEADNIDALFENFTATGPGYPGMSFLDAVASHGIEDDGLLSLFTILSCFVAVTPDVLPAAVAVPMMDAFHYTGMYYFEGGSQAITTALSEAIEATGGVIKRHTLATEIEISQTGQATGIRTSDGGCYTASAVISNASGPATYLNLVGEEHLPEDFAAAVKAREPGNSRVTMVYLGVDEDYSEYFPENAHELFVHGGRTVTVSSIDTLRCLPEESDFMLTNYSVADPDAAPEGKNAIVITADYMDYDCNDAWRFEDTYETYTEYKQAVAEVLVARAAEILPGLTDHIEVMEVASPRTIEQFTLNPRGSWIGWQMAPPSDIVLESVTTPIPGLFMAGAWVTLGGQSSSMASGLEAAMTADGYLGALEGGK